MNTSKKIKFQKERTNKVILNEAFSFYKSNLSTILKMSAGIVIPFLILIIFSSLVNSYYLGQYSQTNKGLPLFLSTYIIQRFVIILYLSIIQAIVLTYLKNYIDNKQNSKIEFKKSVFRRFIQLLKLNTILAFISFFATILLVIPGIYLFNTLLLSSTILVFQEKSIIESLKESNKIVKDNWWPTFRILLALILIVILFSFTITLISYFYLSFKTLFIENNSYLDAPNKFNDPFLLIVYIISILIPSLVYIYAIIVLVLVYFNMAEKDNHNHLYSEIELIGEKIEK